MFTEAEALVAMLEQEAGIRAITDATNLNRQADDRIRDERSGAEASLVGWKLQTQWQANPIGKRKTRRLRRAFMKRCSRLNAL
jgi:hypothetical protein